MTCPFEIVQITMSDCHVELQARVWNAPESDRSQILGHKSTFCWETRLLRGGNFISFHEKTCLPAGENFKTVILPCGGREMSVILQPGSKPFRDSWNWLGQGKRLRGNIWIVPRGEYQWVVWSMSFLTRSSGKIVWMARSGLFLAGGSHALPTKPSDGKLLTRK